MDRKTSPERKGMALKKRGIIIVATLLAVVVTGILIFQSMKPERSVASYCKVYKEENAKLADAQGDTYGVAIFSHRSSRASDFMGAFTRLEQVAPDGIQPDVKTLKQIFQKIDSDPSQNISASLSGLGAESNVKKWTDQHCNP